MAAFQLRFIALAIDAIDRHDPTNEMRRQLQAVLAVYIAAKDVLPILHY